MEKIKYWWENDEQAKKRLEEQLEDFQYRTKTIYICDWYDGVCGRTRCQEEFNSLESLKQHFVDEHSDFKTINEFEYKLKNKEFIEIK